MWRPYDWPDALTIERSFGDKPFWVEPRQVVCPIEQTVTVRSYFQRLSGGKTARYRWCSGCHHYSGQTVGKPPPPVFADPVQADVVRGLQRLLDELDGLWDTGILPQAFSL